MKLTLEPTDVIERVNGVPCRKWIGASDAGTPVHAWIATVQPQTHDEAALRAFDDALRPVKGERRLASFDLRLVI